VRFTQKANAVYAFVLGQPKTSTVTIRDLTLKPGATITLLGASGNLAWTQKAADLQLDLPPTLPGNYAYALKIVGGVE